jgi:hypothetical protein
MNRIAIISLAVVLNLQPASFQNPRTLISLFCIREFDQTIEAFPPDSNNTNLQPFVFSNGNFDNPVFVDILSGAVYEIPNTSWNKNGKTYTFKNIPVYDAPILIIDKV